MTIACVQQLAFKVRNEDLLGRYRQSPYIGRRLTAQVAQTILRGRYFESVRIMFELSEPAGIWDSDPEIVIGLYAVVFLK